jgi:hypothetical protein
VETFATQEEEEEEEEEGGGKRRERDREKIASHIEYYASSIGIDFYTWNVVCTLFKIVLPNIVHKR